MKAAVMKDINVLKVEDVPEPQVGPDQIKVKIAYCGICGTDPEILEGRFGAGRPPGAGPQGPRINGHEASGTIVEVGSNCRQGYKVGQRVAMNFRNPCGACYYCRNKKEHFCQKATPASGAFAEYAVYKEVAIYPLPDNISMEYGALLEPVSMAVHITDLGDIHSGSSVAICGAGPIGLLSLELAVKCGATKILVSEPVAEKRQLALKLGADVAVDPLKENLEKIGKDLTEGRGFDTVIEASGNLGAARQAVSLADRGGIVVWAAVYAQGAEVPVIPFYMYANELTIRSVFLSPYCFPRALNLLSRLDLKPIITDIIPLQDISHAFEVHKKGKSVKILIKP
jgi:2-desacetyl-2-hydroxyethyl bacteriochlorophyllide A dehydrogenase